MFLNWCLNQNNIKGTGSASSQTFKTWGTKLYKKPILGAIAVFQDIDDPIHGHVNLVIGQTETGEIVSIGGNQGDAVNYSIGVDRKGKIFLGYVYPKDYVQYFDILPFFVKNNIEKAKQKNLNKNSNNHESTR